MSSEDGQTGRSAAWGITAGIFAAGVFATWPVAVAPKSTFPIWPTYAFAGAAALALYMCFAAIWGWWPAARSIRGSSADAAELSAKPDTAAIDTGASASLAGSTADAPVNLPAPPVAIRLQGEIDAATNRLRLGALNRGGLGRFRVEVIDAHNQDGNWLGPRSWPVPWLEDSSVGSKDIPTCAKPLLDFARFDFSALQEDLEGTKWVRGDHWVFSSLPEPVKFTYSAVREWSDLNTQYVVVTVRVVRDDPEGHVDIQFKVGTYGTQPYFRELPEKPASTPPPMDLQRFRDLAVNGPLKQPAGVGSESSSGPESASAVTDRWRHTSDGGKVPSLMRLTHTSLFHPGYSGRQSQDEPPSVKIGTLVACRPIDPLSSGSELRAQFVTFLNSEAVRELVGALTSVASNVSWNSLAGHGPRTLEAALTTGDNPMEGVPTASALFLPPTAGESLYGRDGRSATLMVYVEPRTAEGGVPPASDLATWHRRLSLALAIPAAFADFLANDLGLGTSSGPPAQFGVWLKSYQPLTKTMFNTQGLRILPGSSPSNQFMGWAYADTDGHSIKGTARDLLTQACEYTLHLDGFEQVLTAIDDSSGG